MALDEATKSLLESLPNRIITDANGVKGRIISAEFIPDGNRCEIAIKYDDNTSSIDAKSSVQYWFDKSKEPPPIKRKIIYTKRKTNALQQNSGTL